MIKDVMFDVLGLITSTVRTVNIKQRRSPPASFPFKAARPCLSGRNCAWYLFAVRGKGRASRSLGDSARCGGSSLSLSGHNTGSSFGTHCRPQTRVLAMVSWMISRLVVLIFGTLYPAYSSYKAVKTKNVKEYVKWMMYWIVFAFFTTAETLTDLILSWFPFYFELKIAFVIWLLSPYTKGSSVLYRKFVHPTLSSKEKEIDEYISQAKDRSYQTMMRFGKRGLNLAANAAVTAAAKGQGVLSDKLRSFSMQDLTLLRDEDSVHLRSPDPRMRTSTGNLLETISDSGEELGNAQAQKSDGEQPDVKLEQADEDTVDKVPKRTQSLKASKQKLQRSEPQSKSVKLRAKKKATSTASSPESA
ncbi:receptor expression-enhancing protein 2 isoform X2 [Hemitrygon akajei]|uniref:receptor expression-enhancing protein 2 isoform X2 n=1 Tax=Hemitrygon akajei TaxID=2704970 RepID=UPI003BF94D4B